MKLLQSYFHFVYASRRKLVLVILLSVGSALFQGASIGLLLPALEIVEKQGALESSGLIWRALEFSFGAVGLPVTLSTLLLGVLAMIALAQALLYAQRHLSAAMSEDLVAALRKHAFDTFMRADLSFHHRIRAGTLVSGLTQDLQRTGAAFDGLLELMTRSVLIVMYVNMLFLVSWQTALAALAMVAGASALIQYQILTSKRIGQQMVDLQKQLYGFISERTEAVRLVKLKSAEKLETERFWKLVRKVGDLKCLYMRRGAQIRFLMEPTLAAGGVVATYVGLTFFHMSLAQLAVFMYLLVRIVPEAYSLNRSRYAVAGFVNHFYNTMELIQRSASQTTMASGSRPFTGLRHAIVFEDVSFGYDSGPPVLHHLNLTLEVGCFTAIIGPSGIGKSTLLDLIPRLIVPVDGRILLDGVDAREFDLISLRRGIGMVNQDIVLFNDTVLENIRYGCPDASEEEVVEAAIQANAHQFIQALPHGYHTLLGPRGMTLSGGERQRIALARALLLKPSLLLLDEVTSGLDAESEHLIQESVFQAARDKTVIVVAHRLSTVRKARKIIVLDQGRVAEEGTPEKLLEGDGLFRRYHHLQLAEVELQR